MSSKRTLAAVHLAAASAIFAGAGSAAVRADPVTRHYVAALRSGYLPVIVAFDNALGPCTQTPTAASLSRCRSLDALAATDTQTLLSSLRQVQVPKAARSADRRFRGAMNAFRSSLNSRIKYIDANNLAAFKKADGAVSYALSLVSQAVSALNRAVPTAHLPQLIP